MCSMKPPYRYSEMGCPGLRASTTAETAADRSVEAAAGSAEVKARATEPSRAARRDMSGYSSMGGHSDVVGYPNVDGYLFNAALLELQSSMAIPMRAGERVRQIRWA